MALTTNIYFVYPPAYQSGDYRRGEGQIGPNRWSVYMQAVGTATEDEAYVRKLVLSDLITPDGKEPSKFIIDQIFYWARGFTGLTLFFDRVPIPPAFFSMGGANDGFIDYRQHGGLADQKTEGTGDILCSTTGGDANDSYNIKIDFRVK